MNWFRFNWLTKDECAEDLNKSSKKVAGSNPCRPNAFSRFGDTILKKIMKETLSNKNTRVKQLVNQYVSLKDFFRV